LSCNQSDANNEQVVFAHSTIKSVLSPSTQTHDDTRAGVHVIARKRERGEWSDASATARACDSVWRGMFAIYQGIDNTRQRVARCATQRSGTSWTVHTHTHTHTRKHARIYGRGCTHIERKRRRSRTLWGIGPKGT